MSIKTTENETIGLIPKTFYTFNVNIFEDLTTVLNIGFNIEQKLHLKKWNLWEETFYLLKYCSR